MSEGPLVPGRKRRTSLRSTPTNSLPTTHVTLGRTYLLRRKIGPKGLHIVVESGDGWVTLCKGARAVKSFRGRPDQSGCVHCKRARETGPLSLPGDVA